MILAIQQDIARAAQQPLLRSPIGASGKSSGRHPILACSSPSCGGTGCHSAWFLAPGYRGRKRGEVVRTRTTVAQAHRYQWLGSFGNRGNGRYREELCKGLAAIGWYLTVHHLPQERALLRLDGQYGNGAVLADVTGFAFVTRGKDYRLLDHPLIQARLHLPPDQFQQRPESQMVHSLYDCPQIPVGPKGAPCRVIVATQPSLGRRKAR